MRQISLFDGKHQFKITKPIRLIELFAGIGSQAKALRNLGANFEHYRICEFDKYAVQSYNEIHGTSFETSDITKIKAADLGITETDKYEYIMTYSFPCQDLSIAGKQKGMAKGSATRSGLLWEVERLLNEMTELPQILLMENVPQVHGKKNIDSFREWQQFLESKGYKNYWQDLNAKNFGIPQNRNRTFMVSLLGDYFYEFPQSIPLKLRLKDMLEKEVDEKYYLSENMLKYINSYDKKYKVNDNRLVLNREIASLISTRTGQNRADCSDYISNVLPDNFNIAGKDLTCNNKPKWESNNLLKEPIIVDDIYNNREPREYGDTAPTLRSERQGLKVVEPIPNERFFRQAIETASETVDKTGISPTITTRPEGFKTAILPIVNIRNVMTETATALGTNCGSSTSAGGGVAVINDLRIRKLTPKECWRLMGFDDTDFDKTTCSNTQLYKQAGNSIVVDVLMAIFKEIL